MTKQTLAIIDYGMGNLHSAHSALEHVAERSGAGTRIVVTNDHQQILDADRVLVPGVGAIRDCVGEIKKQKLDELIKQCISEKPVLGICVGLQAFMSHSMENDGVDCLDIFKGEVKFFSDYFTEHNITDLKVPHMGWNEVEQVDHPLWHNIADRSRFYFVHSYYADVANEAETIGRCSYGPRFSAAVARDNVAAVQFHPEKSADAGLQLLENFLQWA